MFIESVIDTVVLIIGVLRLVKHYTDKLADCIVSLCSDKMKYPDILTTPVRSPPRQFPAVYVT